MIDINKLAEAMGKQAAYAPVAASEYTDTREPVAPDFELDDDGEEYQSVGVNGILAATEKQLAINRGLADVDERDSMQFQKVLRPHALFRERVKMDSGKLARTAMYRAAKMKNLSGIGPGYFNGYIESVLVGNPLTSPLEEINMMQLVANARRITRMGPGGLPSSDSITEESQSVHPSQFGFISPIEGPECFSSDTQILTSKGWVDITSISEDTELACSVDGRLEFHKPERVIHTPYKGVMYGVKNANTDFLVTPGHRLIGYTDLSDAAYKAPLRTLFSMECSGTDFIIPSICARYDSSGAKEASEIADEHIISAGDWYEQEYAGTVHCATVPGGMLYTRRNGKSGVWTGNSERAGIDVRVAMGAKIGSNGRLYQKMYNRVKKRFEWVSPGDIAGRVVKLPQ